MMVNECWLVGIVVAAPGPELMGVLVVGQNQVLTGSHPGPQLGCGARSCAPGSGPWMLIWRSGPSRGWGDGTTAYPAAAGGSVLLARDRAQPGALMLSGGTSS